MRFNGIVPYILKNIGDIAGSNDPQKKITSPGFLRMLLDYSPNIQYPEIHDGECRDLRIRYMPRGCDNVIDAPVCEGIISPSWKEQTIPELLYRGVSMVIPYDLLCKLEREAMQPESFGTPAAEGWKILWAFMQTNINDLLTQIDKTLLLEQAAKWGVNVAYTPANNTPKNIIFGKTQGMTDGIVRLITDAQTNEISGRFPIVGNGAVNNFMVWNNMKSGTDLLGFGSQDFSIYNDVHSTSVWGANHFGVFEPGYIGLIHVNQYGNIVRGQFGDTFYFRIPIQIDGGKTIWFDAMMKKDGCPMPTIHLVISLNYALWNMPSEVFNTCDRLSGYNGSLHYVGVNEDCIRVCTSGSSEPEVEPEEKP